MSINLDPIQLSVNPQSAPSSSTLPKPSSTLHTSRTQRTLNPQQLQKKINQLYHENEKWMAKKQKLRQQINIARSAEDMKQCTFHPSVNPQMDFNGSKPSHFLKRQIDWLQKKQKKIQEMSRQSQKKLKKQCSFHPKISQKTYSILYNPNKTSRAVFSSERSEVQNKKTSSDKKNDSYRKIHMKKQSFKELQKSNSVYHFNLMTQRRFINKYAQQDEFCDEGFNFSDFKVPSNTPKVSEFKSTGGQDYIENIVIKSQEQDTFNSLTSLELKTDRKEHNETDVQSEPVKIFEQQSAEEEQHSEDSQPDVVQEDQEQYDQHQTKNIVLQNEDQQCL